ncbi:hypothetical protein DRN69_07055 [Candidatus Pacearchaeota archaeon]|nr:MAG: hypothetical protein DRN69_07055 [Candidatus Pacearchaeota archaeon]
MPKESFEQFFKRQEKKLDKAEKMVEEVEKELKIKEFEMVGKSVKKLKKLWEENEARFKEMSYIRIFSFYQHSLPLLRTSPFLLGRTSNKFLKEFDWKKFEGRRFLDTDLGLFISAFLKKNIEHYIWFQKSRGFEEGQIKPIEVHLKVKELPVILSYLGYKNPKKLHLIIKGNCGNRTGWKMQGGKIIVEGNCGRGVGFEMRGGRIIVERNCEEVTGHAMKGGELNIKGEVKSFDKSAFSPNNKGTIIWKNTKIWENGDWTKEGKEMWEKGEIPVI